MPEFLPYSRQTIEADDIAAVKAVLRSDFLTTGPECAAFEQELQSFMQVPYAVCVNSGTAALHLAWRALDLAEGSQVILPAVTFLSAAATAIACGLEVIFADCDPMTGLMSAQTVEAAAQGHDNIKAVCVVHLNGQFAPMKEIAALAQTCGWRIIEDACHIIGGQQEGQDGRFYPAGSCHFADATVFSLHAVKTITTGEGGIVTCKNGAMAENMRDRRTHGMVRDPNRLQDSTHAGALWYHEMQTLGANYRMSDIQAALGRTQLRKLERFVSARQKAHGIYAERLQSLAPHVTLVPTAMTGVPARHLAVVLIDFEACGVTRTALMGQLHQDGIGTQLHYIPLYRQPFFVKTHGEMRLAGAEQYYARALSLPIFPDIREQDIARAVERLAVHLRLKI